jgi:putative endopeptidase
VNPGDSFMRYANGAALDEMQIPSDRTSYGSFALLRELSDNRVKAMIDGLAARTDLTTGSDEQKIADAYRSYMDEARIEALDAQPLAPYLAAIRAANTHELAAVYMGDTQGRIGGSIFGTGITTDQKAPTRYVVSTGQSGLGLPNRDYYLEQRWAEKKVLYQAYVARMLDHDRLGKPDRIRRSHRGLRDPHRRGALDPDPEPQPRRDLQRIHHRPAGLGSSRLPVAGLLHRRRRGRGSAPDRPSGHGHAEDRGHLRRDADGGHPGLAGLPHHRRRRAAPVAPVRRRPVGVPLARPERPADAAPRDKRGISFAEGMLGEAVGRQYVAEYFPAESKAKMEQLVANLRTALGDRIANYSWMSAETRAAAQEKLDKFTVKIGYPNKWRDYSAPGNPPDDLFGNTERAGLFQWNYQLNRLNQPVDKTEWGMTPQTVNAYYNSTNNEIVFPAAILQPPFFDPDADPAVNYGGIGGVIGHEIGHGFDDQGSKSDGDGVLRTGGPRGQGQFRRPDHPSGRPVRRLRADPGLPRPGRPDHGREHRRRRRRGGGSGGLPPVAERPAAPGSGRHDRRPALLLRLGPGVAVEDARRRRASSRSPPTRTARPSSASSARCATSTPGTRRSASSPARNTTSPRKTGFASGRDGRRN